MQLRSPRWRLLSSHARLANLYTGSLISAFHATALVGSEGWGRSGARLAPAFSSAPGGAPTPTCRPKGALSRLHRLRRIGREELAQGWRRRRPLSRVRIRGWMCGPAAPQSRRPAWLGPAPRRRISQDSAGLASIRTQKLKGPHITPKKSTGYDSIITDRKRGGYCKCCPILVTPTIRGEKGRGGLR